MTNFVKRCFVFLKVVIQNYWFGSRYGINSQDYWDARFKTNWVSYGGRLQTALFALGFISTRPTIKPATILDFGCGAGDALPVLRLMFPEAQLYFYDFSSSAMQLTASSYGNIAEPWTSQGRCDLVYCSNVIEHIYDLDAFLKMLAQQSYRYLVILAPYNERHAHGECLSIERPKDEHVRSVKEGVVEKSLTNYSWKHDVIELPWDPTGRQIVFFGKLL